MINVIVCTIKREWEIQVCPFIYIHAESKKHHNCSKLVLISLRPCSTIKVTSPSNFYLIYRNICLVAFPENIQWVNLNRSTLNWYICVIGIYSVIDFYFAFLVFVN